MQTASLPWLPNNLAEIRDQFARDYVFNGASDIFQPSYGAGYWLYGVEYDDRLGWLAYEYDEHDPHYDDDSRHREAIEAWRAGRPLPEHYYKLDAEFAAKAFTNGCRKWGEWWYDDVDLPAIDEVVQYTLLGEQRYG